LHAHETDILTPGTVGPQPALGLRAASPVRGYSTAAGRKRLYSGPMPTSTDLFAKAREHERVQQLKAARAIDMLPYFRVLEGPTLPVVMMEGAPRVMLGSNNYLGLTGDERVRQAALDAVNRYGTGITGSRFLNGTLAMHLELECELARFLNKEAAVVFSTGFQSNLGIISALVSRGDYIICDRENHASIYDGCQLSHGTMVRYKHSDMADLERVLSKIPDSAGKLIVTDGVFSMSGDVANLPQIVRIAKKYEARIMVDDAHGLGVLGDAGRGTADFFGLADEIDIYMGTFSKSLASLGGYMAGKEYIVDYVRHNARSFIFSASITPTSCAVALAALKHLEAHPELVRRLSHNSEYTRDGLRNRGIRIRESSIPGAALASTPIIPIYTYEFENTLVTGKALYDAGVYVNPVLPPATPATECLLRISCMATHTEMILDEAMDIIASVLETLSVQKS